MKAQLKDELINILIPHVDGETLEIIKMQIEMLLHDYNVTQEETALTIYEEDETVVVFNRFLSAKIARGCSPRTVVYYKNSVSTALRIIGKPYDQVTADDIRYYLAMRVQRDGVSKRTANNERRCLSSFYGWLQTEEILLRNPMSKVDAIKEKKKKRHAFSQMELELIRAACGSARETALIEVLISTWARVSEVASIKISDIHENSITVLGKGEKERDVYLTPRAQLAIRTYLGERNDGNPYLFPRAAFAGNWGSIQGTKKGKAAKKDWYKVADLVSKAEHMDVSSLESVARNIGRRANVTNVHPHRFRRTGATIALKSGMPLIQVSKLLGHESIETTQIYLDVSDEELMQAHNKYVV